MVVRCVVVFCLACLVAAAQDDPPPQGMEILPLVKKAGELISPKPPPVPGRAWSDDLAALTNPDPAVSNPAIGRLVRRGAEVLADLGVLAADRDWQVRARVAEVAAGIGGEAGAPLVIRLSQDANPRVRRMATVGLGRCRGDPVLTRLGELLASRDADDRCEAASSLAAFGDPRAIKLLTGLRADNDVPARNAAEAALRTLVRLPTSAPLVSDLLGSLVGEERRALLEALDGAVDTRLCPALVRLVDDREALTSFLAIRALLSAGDARAIEPLVKLATSQRLEKLRDAAAETLRVRTDYHAGPGEAWRIWWQDNAARAARLSQRDGLLAQLMDPAAAIPAGLTAFPPADLMPLVDAAVGAGRPVPTWYAVRALAALHAQAGERWVQPLTDRIDAEKDPEARLDLMVVLDDVGGAAAHDAFIGLRQRLETRETAALKEWQEKGVMPPDTRPERALITAALGRK